MKLLRLRLADFRNIASADLAFDCRRTFLLGANGQGKTNLLEAAGLLHALRSFRTRETDLLIRHAAPALQAGYTLEHEREGTVNIALTLTPKSKTVVIDGETVRQFSDFLGRFPVVVFSSDDIALLRGSPAERRRRLDLLVASNDAEYLTALRRYHRALEARNRILKHPAPDTLQLAAFEKTLAPHAVKINAGRKKFFEEIAGDFTHACAEIGLPENAAALAFNPGADLKSETEFLKFYERRRTGDIALRATQHGPHRDDFDFRFAGRHAQDVASEGQQRGLVLAFGLASLARLREKRGVAPLVLADDVLGELDPIRKTGFWRALGDDCQVIATGTAPPPNAENWHVIEVAEGNYR